MALLLEPEEVAARVELYTTLQLAIADVQAAQALPDTAPDFVVVDYTEPTGGERLLGEVCKRAWTSLRASAMKLAAERLRKAEEAVRRFEAGEDV